MYFFDLFKTSSTNLIQENIVNSKESLLISFVVYFIALVLTIPFLAINLYNNLPYYSQSNVYYNSKELADKLKLFSGISIKQSKLSFEFLISDKIDISQLKVSNSSNTDFKIEISKQVPIFYTFSYENSNFKSILDLYKLDNLDYLNHFSKHNPIISYSLESKFKEQEFIYSSIEFNISSGKINKIYNKRYLNGNNIKFKLIPTIISRDNCFVYSCLKLDLEYEIHLETIETSNNFSLEFYLEKYIFIKEINFSKYKYKFEYFFMLFVTIFIVIKNLFVFNIEKILMIKFYIQMINKFINFSGPNLDSGPNSFKWHQSKDERKSVIKTILSKNQQTVYENARDSKFVTLQNTQLLTQTKHLQEFDIQKSVANEKNEASEDNEITNKNNITSKFKLEKERSIKRERNYQGVSRLNNVYKPHRNIVEFLSTREKDSQVYLSRKNRILYSFCFFLYNNSDKLKTNKCFKYFFNFETEIVINLGKELIQHINSFSLVQTKNSLTNLKSILFDHDSNILLNLIDGFYNFEYDKKKIVNSKYLLNSDEELLIKCNKAYNTVISNLGTSSLTKNLIDFIDFKVEKLSLNN